MRGFLDGAVSKEKRKDAFQGSAVSHVEKEWRKWPGFYHGHRDYCHTHCQPIHESYDRAP